MLRVFSSRFPGAFEHISSHTSTVITMLSIATSSALGFAPIVRLAPSRAAASIVMQEPPVPVLSEVGDTAKASSYDELAPGYSFDPNAFAQSLPGVTAPLGFWDPAGFCSSDNGADGTATEGKVRFYREVELKHGRVAMLAALGFPLAEVFHPLFGGNVDVPSYIAFQQTPLQTFWPAVVLVIAAIEVSSMCAAGS